jgi:response regulator RpfG family c-di-GMP phosphodiesterase
VQEVGTGSDIHQLALEGRTDLILVEQAHSKILEVCSALRSDPRTASIPVIHISPANDKTAFRPERDPARLTQTFRSRWIPRF